LKPCVVPDGVDDRGQVGSNDRVGQAESGRTSVHGVDANPAQERVCCHVVADGEHGYNQVSQGDFNIVIEERKPDRPGCPIRG